MMMDSPMLSPCDGDYYESNSIYVALPLYYSASSGLTYIIKAGEGFGTFDKRLEHFSSATINSRYLESH